MSFQLPLHSPSVIPQLHFLWFVSSSLLCVHNTVHREELIHCFLAASFRWLKALSQLPSAFSSWPWTVVSVYLALRRCTTEDVFASLHCRGCLCVFAPRGISLHCCTAGDDFASHRCIAEDVFQRWWRVAQQWHLPLLPVLCRQQTCWRYILTLHAGHWWRS